MFLDLLKTRKISTLIWEIWRGSPRSTSDLLDFLPDLGNLQRCTETPPVGMWDISELRGSWETTNTILLSSSRSLTRCHCFRGRAGDVRWTWDLENPINLTWISEIHVRFPKSGSRFRGFGGGPKTHQKWSEQFFIDCRWKLSRLSIELCLLGPIASRSKKPAGHPYTVQRRSNNLCNECTADSD